MVNVLTELTKPIFKADKSNGQISGSFQINDLKFKPLSLGGDEGIKFLTSLVNPRNIKDRNGAVAEKFEFISKEYKHDRVTDVIKIIQTYDFLRKRGYPVPATTRYFEKDGKIYLLMTNVTEKGKYLVWGYSDTMSKEQQADLLSMNLTDNDIQNIRDMALTYATKAGKDDIDLPFCTYHVRKNLETGKIDIIFLDADTSMLEPQSSVDEIKINNNPQHAFTFIRVLEEQLKVKLPK